jgi:DNA-binding transcriptional MerR regulator
VRMGPWIRIGDSARLARTTVRTLRHYEQEGLLRPTPLERLDAEVVNFIRRESAPTPQ